MKRLLCLTVAAALAAQGSPPLRQQAIERGLKFIYQTASDVKNFAEHGEDYLWCFYSIASTSKDPALSRTAWEIGRERAAVWMRDYSTLKPGARADEIADLAYGAYAAQQLGFPDPKLKEQLRQAAAKFSAEDYLLFDPRREAPPANVPKECSKCSHQNRSGAVVCERDGTPLTMRSRYDVWLDALITTYFGDRYEVTMGAPYQDVARWAPTMRPYRGSDGGENREFYSIVYSITHLIYTQDDYSTRRLSPRAFPDELLFLKTNLHEAIAREDPETMGEFLDSLKAFGLKNRDPLIRKGRKYLLSTQNPDGSWGDADSKDVYDRYHPTWTAVDGLRDYKWDVPNFVWSH